MKKRTIFEIFYAVLVLVLFYYVNIPLNIIGIFAAFFLLVLLVKGKLYRTIDYFLKKHIKFLSKINPKLRKIVIILIFLIILILVKQIIYFVLGLFGIDLESELMASINNTLVNQS